MDVVNDFDNVLPGHYKQGTIECIDAMQLAFGDKALANFCRINAFKYIWRCREKNGYEDLDKARWYLDKAKELDNKHGDTVELLEHMIEKAGEKL